MASPFGGIFHDYLLGPWEEARHYLREELEQLYVALTANWSKSFNKDGSIQGSVFSGDSEVDTVYVSNEGPDHSPQWAKVNLAKGVKGRLTLSNLPTASPNTLLGRDDGVGNYTPITLGDGLTIEANTLKVQAFPVGAVFMAAVSDTPEDLLGYGTWELIAVGVTPASPSDPIPFFYQNV